MSETQSQKARAWLDRRTLTVEQPVMLQRARAEVQGIERLWPGYAEQLRLAARELMRAADARVARTAIAVFAAIGTADDVAGLRHVAAGGSPYGDDIRRAVTEIEDREARGQDPLRMVEVAPLRQLLGRITMGALGFTAIVFIVIRVLRDLEHGNLGLKTILAGLALLGGGIWLLAGAWTGELPTYSQPENR